MSNRRNNIVTLCLLGGCILGFGLWARFKPDDALSQSERRQLTQRPALTLSSVMDGSYMSNYEKYAPDQFPLRDSFRTVKALVSYDLLRQKDNNGVYLENGYASKLEYPMNLDSLDHAAERFQYLYEHYLKDNAGKLYLSVIPDKNAFLAQQGGYPAMDYDVFIQEVRERAPYLQYIDVTDLLSIEDYYRTDLHWRQEQIADVAQRLAQEMGTQVGDRYREKELERPYYGVYYGYAALPLPAEQIRYLTSDVLEACTVYNYETQTTGPIYDLEKGSGKDPYELFLSGSVSLLRIDNPAADTDRELIIFRDSFGSSLAPLLAEGYKTITLVDIRYLGSPMLGRMLDFHGQDVLFLYSTGVLNHSETLK